MVVVFRCDVNVISFVILNKNEMFVRMYEGVLNELLIDGIVVFYVSIYEVVCFYNKILFLKCFLMGGIKLVVCCFLLCC